MGRCAFVRVWACCASAVSSPKQQQKAPKPGRAVQSRTVPDCALHRLGLCSEHTNSGSYKGPSDPKLPKKDFKAIKKELTASILLPRYNPRWPTSHCQSGGCWEGSITLLCSTLLHSTLLSDTRAFSLREDKVQLLLCSL